MKDTNTWMRLANGSWGVRVVGEAPTPGKAVIVTGRGGEKKSVVIKEVFRSDEFGHVCSIVADNDR